MGEVSIISLDRTKTVFQAHCLGLDGSVVFRRKLSRAQLLKFMAAQAPCGVAMEACASAHHWGRAIRDLGRSSSNEGSLCEANPGPHPSPVDSVVAVAAR